MILHSSIPVSFSCAFSFHSCPNFSATTMATSPPVLTTTEMLAGNADNLRQSGSIIGEKETSHLCLERYQILMNSIPTMAAKSLSSSCLLSFQESYWESFQHSCSFCCYWCLHCIFTEGKTILTTVGRATKLYMKCTAMLKHAFDIQFSKKAWEC